MYLFREIIFVSCISCCLARLSYTLNGFREDAVRQVYAPLIGVAYARNDEEALRCLAHHSSGEMTRFSANGVSVSVIVEKARSEVIVAVRGPVSFSQFMRQAGSLAFEKPVKAVFKKRDHGDKPFEQFHVGNVIPYFLECLDAIYPHMYGHLNMLHYHLRYYDFVFTGHSLGGAIAALFSLRFALHQGSSMGLVTIGAPRVGDAKLEENFRIYIPTALRIAQQQDAVVRFNSMIEPIKHVGREVYYYDGTESTFTECQVADDMKCGMEKRVHDIDLFIEILAHKPWHIDQFLSYYGVRFATMCLPEAEAKSWTFIPPTEIPAVIHMLEHYKQQASAAVLDEVDFTGLIKWLEYIAR